MPKSTKQEFGKILPSERDMLTEIIKIAASVAGCAAGVLGLDEREPYANRVIIDNARGELGMVLGEMNAAISHVMSTGVPDRDFALVGMQRRQEKLRSLLGERG